MKATVIEGAEIIARDWLTLALVGLGITFSPDMYIGGLFLALAGASAATKWDKENQRLNKEGKRWDIFGTLIVAFFVSHLAVLAVYWVWPSFPPQITMSAAGFGSRSIARMGLRFLQRIETRGDSLSDRVIDRFLPGDDKPEDKQ